MLIDPLAQTIAAYDRLSDDYSARWFQSQVLEAFLAKFLSNMGNKPVVMDAGCGSGREIKHLVEKGIDSVGVDLSFATVKKARQNVPDGHFRVMDLRDLEYPNDLFDGVLCVAVVHHLYDRDFQKALREISRVTKRDGKIGLTIRLGDGYNFDDFGRFLFLRSKEESENLIRSMGFSIIESEISSDGSDRKWLQLILSNLAKADADVRSSCSFCLGPFFLKENRSIAAPIAASILWGDADYYVTMDISPLVDGHLLLCTQRHVLSTLGSEQNLESLSRHKNEIDRILKSTFKRRPVFLEHGTKQDDQTRDSCIEHAHIHALPIKNELRSRVETRIGQLNRYRSISSADRAVGCDEYISYENKRGDIFLKRENVDKLPSQFFRLVVADSLDIEKYHWVQTRDDLDSRERFLRSLRAIVDVLDRETADRDIISDISHDLRLQLSNPEQPNKDGSISSKTSKKVGEKIVSLCNGKTLNKIELSELGERQIIDHMLIPFFDGGFRGARYIGDDAAVVTWENKKLLATTDHCPTPLFFKLGISSYLAYGWLSVTISMSDIAAMGGTPKTILLNTEMPETMKAVDYLSFVEGVQFAAKMYGARVIGGNIREAKTFSASTTLLGEPTYEKPLLRDGAEPGQAIFVAGKMGLFWAGMLERHFKLVLPLENHKELNSGLFFPEPKIHAAQALSATGIVGACMDASDGPTQALSSLATANSCDFVVDMSLVVPNHSVTMVAKFTGLDPKVLMFTWGNFELIFTAFEDDLYERFEHELKNYKIHKIGYVKAGSGRALLKQGRSNSELPQLAFDRFRKNQTGLTVDNYHTFLKTIRFSK